MISLSLMMMAMAACGGGDAGAGSTTGVVTGPPTDAPAAAAVPGGSGPAQPASTTPLPAPEGGGGRTGTGSTTPSGATTSSGGSTDTPAAGTTPAPRVSVDVCAGILATSKPLLSGMENARIPERAAPALREAIEDPTYHACIARVTDNDPASRNPYLRSDYSRRQAFNADSSRILTYALDGFWHLYDARDLKPLGVLKGPAGDAEPQWHPTDPNLLHYLNRNGIGMQIHALDVRTSQSTVIADMNAQVKAIWPGANAAWTRSEGSPSADGRYWCFLAEYGSQSSWRTFGAFTWDLHEKRVIGSMPLSERPDHLSMSPSGRYCVISSDGSDGTRAYSRDFRTPHPANPGKPWLQLQSKSEHSDIALNPDGSDAYVAVDYRRDDVFSINLDTGRRTSLFHIYPGRTSTAVHISGKAYRHPGWALISTYGEYHPDDMSQVLRNTSHQQWLHRKMFAISLDGRNTIRPIAHVDSTIHDNDDVDNYWAEPQATVNPDFTRMLFNSTWNGKSDAEVETWLAAIRPGALTR